MEKFLKKLTWQKLSKESSRYSLIIIVSKVEEKISKYYSFRTIGAVSARISRMEGTYLTLYT